MAESMQVAESVGRRYAVLRPHLDERQRRLMLGSEAAELGRGGIKTVAEATGAHPDTVARGVRELAGGTEPQARVRGPGGGRKKLSESDPGLRASSPGSDSDSFFRPPPGPRTRACGSVPPASSRTPRATVSGCAPVASATVLIPPRPSSAASEPNRRRRCRSSRCGRSTAYLRPTDSATCMLSAIAQRYDPQTGKPRLFLSLIHI